jgi:hypothetical protein
MRLLRTTTRRLMILVAIGAVLFAAARSSGRFRFCMHLADNYGWLRSQEPYARGMVAGTMDQERLVVEPSRVRADYYGRTERMYRRAAWRFWEPIPTTPPPP